MPRMSSNGQKFTRSIRRPLLPQFRYGDWIFDGLKVVDVLKMPFHIVTAVPAATAASPCSHCPPRESDREETQGVWLQHICEDNVSQRQHGRRCMYVSFGRPQSIGHYATIWRHESSRSDATHNLASQHATHMLQYAPSFRQAADSDQF